MKVSFKSSSNYITIIDKSTYSNYLDFEIINTKSFIKIYITRKYDIAYIGNKLLKSEISLRRFLRLKKNMKKKRIIKIRKDKNTKVLIEESLFK